MSPIPAPPHRPLPRRWWPRSSGACCCIPIETRPAAFAFTYSADSVYRITIFNGCYSGDWAGIRAAVPAATVGLDQALVWCRGGGGGAEGEGGYLGIDWATSHSE